MYYKKATHKPLSLLNNDYLWNGIYGFTEPFSAKVSVSAGCFYIGMPQQFLHLIETSTGID